MANNKAKTSPSSRHDIKKIMPIVDQIEALEPKYKALTDDELKAKTQEFKDRLANGETLDDILPEAFATCREAADRVLGLRPYHVQLIGGIVLHQGRIAEMKTGEGKTLVATLPAYLNALTGQGVHIVTVNDYLAKRDSEWMGKVYRFLGLKVGLIIHGLTKAERQAAYSADVIYGTNNEIGFDYLRDNMAVYDRDLVQRELSFAIVDEVDSILIDEARTPLIISGQGEESTKLYQQADIFARDLNAYVVSETDDKEIDEELEQNYDYIVEEKRKSASLTARGIEKAERFFHVDNLSSIENNTLNHHINQAIRAHGIMKKDVDYIVKDNEIIIVDEFTGRLMFGRRFNEGLHQAIEAKESVKIQDESQTLATITFQNFFRLYDKLSGMTGTAMTEKDEFGSIYSLDIVEIPTNKPIVRIDHDDVVFKTDQGKLNAILEQVKACYRKGQPILIGTTSIQKSERISKLLREAHIPHNVLNAKNHEKEAEIIAQAGKFGAITVSTNMAGRGTDITLGGNAEYLAKADLRKAGFNGEVIAEATGYADSNNEDVLRARALYAEKKDAYNKDIKNEADKVRSVGGLYILGTERHEARRIDNQLRGRSGRQGDPGESKFFLSLEDDILRLFGTDRMRKMMDTLNVDENTPIDAKMLTNAIRKAQTKVESRNFQARKDVLDYDDVMNTQREVIYADRRRVLKGEDMRDNVIGMIELSIERAIKNKAGEREHLSVDEFEDAVSKYRNVFLSSSDLNYMDADLETKSIQELIDKVKSKAINIYDQKETIVNERMPGKNGMREIERVVILSVVDEFWTSHLDAMDDLKQNIRLRAYGQEDPVVAFKRVSFEVFEEMTEAIQEEIVYRVFTFRLRQESVGRRRVTKARKAPTSSSVDTAKKEEVITEDNGKKEETPEANESDAAVGKVSNVAENEAEKPKREPIVLGKKIGPNELCPCGSGKKFKKCHGKNGNKRFIPDDT